MKTAYLLSIQPQWLEKILNGEKTIEIRKTIPKCELPIDVYCYCTKNRKMFRVGEHVVFCEDDLYKLPTGKIKYGCSVELMAYDNYDSNNFFNGKTPCKFTLRKIERLERTDYYRKTADTGENTNPRTIIRLRESYEYDECAESCLTTEELKAYGKGKDLYALHIEDLEIFDKPMELREFISASKFEKPFKLSNLRDGEMITYNKRKEQCRLTKAPQTWMRVYVNE